MMDRELLVDQADDSVLLIGADGTIHRTRDSGASWVRER
jgi:hypothetical protein